MIAAIDFVDLQDNNYLYHAGDVFPRDGKAVSHERITELSSNNNKLGQVVIIDKPEPKDDFMNKPEPAEEKAETKPADKPKKRTKRRVN